MNIKSGIIKFLEEKIGKLLDTGLGDCFDSDARSHRNKKIKKPGLPQKKNLLSSKENYEHSEKAIH